ncbi:uncharacterized protein LOC131859887 [Cryptomeria japonica]|uniref:uncharacterized protein LOC131859887 n=1 Tax=Cryptomeria japonica TaxID=3369 RepID=UPI0027D9F89D|nr:uncharacterized protein LOC131859887 [Cryptomeria japonica]
MAEVLGRSIAQKRSHRLWKGIEISRGVEPTTHSQFSDNTSGSQRSLARPFGIIIGHLRGKFLGTLLFAGAGKAKIWKGLLDGCIAKMEGWKSKWLTLAGRLLMLKTTISKMPIFSMACFKLPSMIIKNIQQKMRKFMWNGSQD